MSTRFTKSKLLSGLLMLCIAFSSPSAFAAGGELEGKGTAENPYLIADAADLAAFRDMVNGEASSAKCAKLTADITLSGDWTPFSPSSGYVTEAYAGTFDGDNHTISGLYINASTANQGLFGVINGAEIKNLRVEGSVTSSNNYVGGIVGKIQQGTVINCSFSGNATTTKSGGYAGGIAGYAGNTATQTASISGCANTASVTGQAKGTTGGIVGYAKYAQITNCYNTGTITGATRSGGIAGQLQNDCSASNCYNTGTATADICDFLYSSSSVSNCFYKEKAINAGTGSATECEQITDTDTLLKKLGSAFAADSGNINGGYPILAWQKGEEAAPKNPNISIVGGSALYMQNNGAVPQTTLSVSYTDVDAAPIEWSADGDVISLEQPEDSDENNSKIIVKANNPGKATVTAKIQDSELTAELAITVYPFITAVEIDGDVMVGETVKAKVNILGGNEYDYDNYPELVFGWKYLSADDYSSGNTGTSSYKDISGAVNREFTIPESLKGDYLSFSFLYNGEYKTPSRPVKIHSADYKKLLSDCDNLSISTEDIKADMTIDLPKSGENGSAIVWETNHADIIDADGNVTLPETDTTEVKLKATLSLDGETTAKEFTIKVFSKQAVEDEEKAAEEEEKAKIKAQKIEKLNTVKATLGDYYKITPVFGTDTNIIDILKTDFTEKAVDLSEFNISLTSVEEVYGGAEISESGDITYFYADPNTTPSIKMGSFNASFTLSIDDAEVILTAPVIVYWDQDRVGDTMKSEILDNVTIESVLGENTAADRITSDLVLPKVIDNKKWTLISWQSSDNDVISISSENQTTADTLFNPYVGAVNRGAEDKTVTLTAIFTFQLTNDVTGSETPVTMSKVFDVTVRAVGTEQIEAIKADLNRKLDCGFDKAGLTDAVSGNALTFENGKYTAYNDILFPTTHDFGVDGKYYPITITSDNDEVIKAPEVNNAARCEVYRPAAAQSNADATVTITITDVNSNISVSRAFDITVPPITQSEIDAEMALMQKVKAAYFDGIKGDNAEADNISKNLSPFFEVYEEDGQLVWVRDNESIVNHGIIAVPIDGWEELEAWRLFKSSNPAVITHENLLVSMQRNAKAVNISSVLSSETLGKYGKLYKEDPDKYAVYAGLSDLYYQSVSVDVTVRGKSTSVNMRPMAIEEKINVSFTLKDSSGTLINKITYKNLDEGTTAFDIFQRAMRENGYEYAKTGTYINSVTTPDGRIIKELSEGANSGWLYRVNGAIPDVNMGAYGLSDNDEILVFFTTDYTKEEGVINYSPSGGSSKSHKSPTTPNTTDTSDETDETTSETDNLPEADDKKPTADNSSVQVEFVDIEDGAWYIDAVDYVVSKGLINGVSSTEFAPDASLTRAMLVTILYRMDNAQNVSNTTDFTDIENGEWYFDAVVWANGEGIVKGISETEFAPNDEITREQMAAILYRYAEYKGIDTENAVAEANAFFHNDTDKVSDWAAAAMQYCVASGLICGDTDGNLNPKDSATRAEFAIIIMRAADVMK